MKKTLEKITNTLIDTTKRVVSHVKDNVVIYGAGILTTVGAYNIDKVIPTANAAEVRVKNVIFNGDDYDETSTTNLSTSDLANEKYVSAFEDVSHLDGPSNLDIYTRENGDPNLIGLNAKPFNTPGWNVYFEADTSINNPNPNDIEIIVDDNSDLENRHLIAYDVADPNTQYVVPKDGSVWWMSLSSTTDLSPGEYAHWRVETPATQTGDCSGPMGPGKLDGKVDLYDAVTVWNSWLGETFEGENYLHGDLNYDGKNDLLDQAILSSNWLAGTE